MLMVSGGVRQPANRGRDSSSPDGQRFRRRYRHRGPVSGQFATGQVDGVAPPYDGTTDFGLLGHDPEPAVPGVLRFPCPDNRASARSPAAPTSSLGVYRVRAVHQDPPRTARASRGPGPRCSATRRSVTRADCCRRPSSPTDRSTPVVNYYAPSVPPAAPIPRSCRSSDPARPAADRRRLRRRIDRPHGRRHVLGRRGARPVPRCTSTRSGRLLSAAGAPSGAARAAEPAECRARPRQPAHLARLRVDDPQRQRQPGST